MPNCYLSSILRIFIVETFHKLNWPKYLRNELSRFWPLIISRKVCNFWRDQKWEFLNFAAWTIAAVRENSGRRSCTRRVLMDSEILLLTRSVMHIPLFLYGIVVACSILRCSRYSAKAIYFQTLSLCILVALQANIPSRYDTWSLYCSNISIFPWIGWVRILSDCSSANDIKCREPWNISKET